MEVEHLVEIGFGVQVAAEFDQRLPVVVTLAIEELVEALLNPVLERIEQQRGDGDGDDQSDRPGAGEVLVEEHRSHADRGEVRRRDRARGDGVGHAALEDQVHVHQAVAEDGVAEGQRQEHQRQHGNLHRQRRRAPGQVGDDVEDRERRDRENRAARDPLHLLAQDRRLGVAIAVPQDVRRHHEVSGEIHHLHAVEVPAQHSRWAGAGQQRRCGSPAGSRPAGRPAESASGRRLTRRLRSGKVSEKCRNSAGCSSHATTFDQ